MPTPVMPFLLKEHPAAADFNDEQLSELLGEEFAVGAKRYKLFKVASAVASAAKGKAFKYTSRTGHTVELATAGTDRPCGVTDYLSGPSSLAVGDYVLLQIEGQVNLVPAAAISAGDFGIPGTAGKLADGGSTETESVDFCRVLVASTDDETPSSVLCELLEKLKG